MPEIRKLVGSIRLKDEATKELNKVDKSMNEAKKSAIGLQGIMGAFGGTLFLRQVSEVVGQMLDVAGSFEQNQIAFEVMMGGNVDLAGQLIKDLEDMSLKTPFSPDALIDNAKLLMNFGIAVDDVMPSLQMLGDISGGNREKLNGLALAFAQSASTGRLMGQDLLQMINQGFNPLKVISEQTGKSMGVLKDEMSKGMISFDMVKEAFKTATSEGGLFFGMMEKQSKTWKGLVSTFEGFKGQIFKEIGLVFIDAFKPILETINELAAAFVAWVKESDKNMAILKTIVLALSVAVGVILVASFKSLAIAVWTAFSPIIIPFLIIVGVITALIVLVDDLITGFQGGQSVIFEFFGAIADWFKELMDTTKKVAKFIVKTFLNLPLFIAGLGQKLIEMIFPIDLISEMFADFIDWIADVPGKVMEFFESLGADIVKFMADILPDWAVEFFSEGNNKKIPGRATGGPVTPGDAFIVGEKGPELLVMGSQEGMIRPSVPGSGGLAIGSLINSLVIQVTGTEDVGEEIKEQVLDALNDLSRNIFPAEMGVSVA